MVENNNSTENQIFEAALKVFLKKGLAGARMQEIADEAGINKSMLHYYFRSKEQLFSQVFLQSFKRFTGSVLPLLNETNTWEEKIKTIIEHYGNVMQSNPDLAMFVINELRQNTQGFIEVYQQNSLLESVFIRQLIEAMEKKEIRMVHPAQIWISVLSSIIFPYIAKPMIEVTLDFQGATWETFIGNQKKMAADMIINYLKIL
jgi:AcrR family transcriptional regulator